PAPPVPALHWQSDAGRPGQSAGVGLAEPPGLPRPGRHGGRHDPPALASHFLSNLPARPARDGARLCPHGLVDWASLRAADGGYAAGARPLAHRLRGDAAAQWRGLAAGLVVVTAAAPAGAAAGGGGG